MEDTDETNRQVELLLTRRAAVLGWPEGATRDAVLQAIEEVIVEVELGRFGGSPGP